MGEVHYMISETSKRVGVESHVLRYWEEELELPIGRTEMGHRHYTEDDIQLFCCIKELKEQGMLLKEIKAILPDMLRAKEQLKEKRKAQSEAAPISENLVDNKDVQMLLIEAFQKLLLENNKILEEMVCKGVSQQVTKDVDFLLQANSRQEEERFRKLDQLIRQQQTLRKEVGKPIPAYSLKKLFNSI